MKVVQIVGARPQFIKYFPVQRAIELSGKPIENILVHTGQHYDYAMSEVFFNELGIKHPDYHLGVGSGNHGKQTGQILEKAENTLLKEKPNIVVVYGDTNTTLGGALAAAKMHIPLVHVEAGLRSFNKFMPEEINRVLTDHISSLLLCPTKNAAENLRKEGFTQIANDGNLISDDIDFSSYKIDVHNPLVVNIGDVMYDVLLYAAEVASKKSTVLSRLNLVEKEYNVLTIHRAENTDNLAKLKEIIDFVSTIERLTVFPVHPRTRKLFQEIQNIPNNIKMVEPLSYFDMLWLVKNSAVVLTDSGRLQKEAYWLKVPCITLREQTEWIESIQSGWNVLYKDYKGSHNPIPASDTLYGDGKAAERIVKAICEM